MLVSSCSDPRSAATSEHNAAETDVAEADADGAAALDEGLPADAGLPDELPPELQAAASSTRPERTMFRQAGRLSVILLILRERAAGWPASPHARRVISQRSRGATLIRGRVRGRRAVRSLPHCRTAVAGPASHPDHPEGMIHRPPVRAYRQLGCLPRPRPPDPVALAGTAGLAGIYV
jgi:hypothetical protein